MSVLWRILETLDYSVLRLTGRLPRQKTRLESAPRRPDESASVPKNPAAGDATKLL